MIILGAGLCGLTLAYLLRQSGYRLVILEARRRLGGRICTQYNPNQPPIEMGATWFGQKHKTLVKLLDELGLDYFEQYMGSHAFYDAVSSGPHQVELIPIPTDTEPSYRIKGGSHRLIEQLALHLPSRQIVLDQEVKTIIKSDTHFELRTSDKTYTAHRVVSTIPPALLVSAIDFKPRLDEQIVDIAGHTHTWMGESIKIALSYEEAFWRRTSYSGTIISRGPITEMYDHSDEEHQRHALVGFLDDRYVRARRAQRLMVILDQLRKYFGPQVENFIRYDEYLWRDELYTYTSYSGPMMPHQHNGHPIFNRSGWPEFYIAGSETAKTYPGYMEGAVVRAYEVFRAINKAAK